MSNFTGEGTTTLMGAIMTNSTTSVGGIVTNSADSEDEEEGLMLKWVLIIVFALIHFAFFTMWCMFMWLWCCGFLDKQLGTAPVSRTTGQSKSKPKPNVDRRHLNKNKVIANKKEVDIEQGGTAQHLPGRQVSKGNTYCPEPPTPSRIAPPPPQTSGFVNMAYQVEAPNGEPNQGEVYSYIDDFDDDENYTNAIQEDEYVNVGARIRNKYEEIKGRLSSLVAEREPYENQDAILQYRQNYLDKHENS